MRNQIIAYIIVAWNNEKCKLLLLKPKLQKNSTDLVWVLCKLVSSTSKVV